MAFKLSSTGQKILLWTVFSLLLISIPVGVWIQNQNALKDAPVYSEIPDFQLSDQLGRDFTQDDLMGKIWVTNFIFTSCADTCPRLSEKMKRLGERIEKENFNSVQMLSITVDPENDTPERLLEYSKNYNADPKRWKFLTGDSKSIENTVINGFKISMGKKPSEENPHIFEIIHGDRFVLIDQHQKIRGYFDVSESETRGFEEIIQSIQYINSKTLAKKSS